MKVEKKDLETIAKVFAALSKAKWDGLDGNAIIEINNCFVGLKKLEEKMKEEHQAPSSPSVEVVEEKKKGKK